MNKDQHYWIEHLELIQHPEGGYFKDVLASQQFLQTENHTSRPYYTSIYFLLTKGNPSHFHRLKSDEVWYYHEGSSLSIHLLHPTGNYECIQLGNNPEKGEVLQAVVPKNVIFGSSVDKNGTFSLVSCMVSPGFDYQDFDLFTKEELKADYPQHGKIIDRLAYENIPK